jgi:tRNA pseudouridine55 synthase
MTARMPRPECVVRGIPTPTGHLHRDGITCIFSFTAHYFSRPVNQPSPVVNQVISPAQLYDGAVFVVDKPLGWTSFDVVNKLKWFILKNLPAPLDQGRKRKFKIGHAGTLDPLATGMLVICTGKMTRTISELQGGRKTYTGVIRMGQTTPSFDLETTPGGEYHYAHLTAEQLRETAAAFLGEQLQTPPAFSAKWIDGRRAYEAARNGEEITMRRALIEVHRFDLPEIQLPDLHFEVCVSKGTYIRSLAHDLGQRLNSGSHLASLRRTASEPFSEKDMITMDELIARISAISEHPST